MRLAALLLPLLLLLAIPAGAQRPARAVCDPNNSEKTSIAAIAADPAQWLGRCVSVKGLYAGERLYPDVNAAYGAGASIGGYIDGQGSIEGFWQADFTGRVADCAVAEHDLQVGLLRSPGISLDGRTLGCVRPQGPFLLFMSQSNLRPASVVRRLPPAKGDLEPISSTEPMTPLQRINQFLETLRSGDAAALAGFTSSAYAAEQLLVTNSAVADLRKPGDRPMQLFRLTKPAGDLAMVACWRRTASRANNWPIAVRDADNHPDRPYACIRLHDTGDGPLTVDASQTFEGLPEP